MYILLLCLRSNIFVTTIQSPLISIGTPSPLAIVCGHAFITSTSGPAHLYLLHKIFETTQEDTGKEVWFSYMPGEGIKKITAEYRCTKAKAKAWVFIFL